MNNKKGWKGYEQGLICRGKQYKEGEIAEEERAEICNKGLHYCVLPNRVFEYYSPGENHEFTEVEAMDDVFTDDEVKYCTRRLKIGATVNVFDIAKMSVLAFFDWFDFKGKINKAKESTEVSAGDYGAANAGNYGAANAGNYGAANAGDYGAANAGYCGAANAGDYGAANAGDYGAANAGDYGAANAGNRGAANAGDCGAAIARNNSTISVGKCGVAVAMGNGAKAKGKKGSVLVFTEWKNSEIINARSVIVDDDKVKSDTFYTLKNGRLKEVK